MPGNHTGYRQFTGPRTPASTLTDLYAGLTKANLTDFDMLLSGYSPSADAVAAIGNIARDLRSRRRRGSFGSSPSPSPAPGNFFWALDPVMGDQGRLYVDEAIVPQYRRVCREADLVLPNQFEAELLTGVKIRHLGDVRKVVERLHGDGFGVAHVIVTSIQFDPEDEEEGSSQENKSGGGNSETLTVVGSTKRSDGSARLFKIDLPALPCFFSGTGDMFAALMVVRLREACIAARTQDVRSWQSADHVPATELPLARATEKVLASMQMVLEKTMVARNREMTEWETRHLRAAADVEEEDPADLDRRRYLAQTKAAEVRLVRNTADLLLPEDMFLAEAL